MKRLLSVLDNSLQTLFSNPSVGAIDILARSLAEIYDDAKTRGELPAFAKTCQSHPLHTLIMEDPYSRRAFEKPRGYAGDAVMLDYIYRQNVSTLHGYGRLIHEATINLPNASSIRHRKSLLHKEITDQIKANAQAKILSVAAGHMRELDDINDAKKVKLYALDQDQLSLLEASKSYPKISMYTINDSIKYLLRPNNLTDFDLIYSAGLFDYLSDKVAIALLRSLYGRLRRNGTLILGNFTPDSHGRGFMSGMMDWNLIYRDEADLVRLMKEAEPSASCLVWRDPPGNVAYVKVER